MSNSYQAKFSIFYLKFTELIKIHAFRIKKIIFVLFVLRNTKNNNYLTVIKDNIN